MTLNFNDHVTVVPTTAGANAINGGRWSLGGPAAVAGVPYTAPLWQLMSALGPRISMGGPQLIEQNRIEVRLRPPDNVIIDDPLDGPDLSQEPARRRAEAILKDVDDGATGFRFGVIHTPVAPKPVASSLDVTNDGPRWRPTRDDLTVGGRAVLLYAAKHGHAAGPDFELRMWRMFAPLLLELAGEALATPPSPATRP